MNTQEVLITRKKAIIARVGKWSRHSSKARFIYLRDGEWALTKDIKLALAFTSEKAAENYFVEVGSDRRNEKYIKELRLVKVIKQPRFPRYKETEERIW